MPAPPPIGGDGGNRTATSWIIAGGVAVIVLLLGAIVVVMTDDSEDEGEGDNIAAGESTDTTKAGQDRTTTAAPSTTTAGPSSTTSPSTTSPSTTNPPVTAPAAASPGDCITLTEDGTGLGSVEPCSSGQGPYRVTQVVESIDDCPATVAGGGRVESGDFFLCVGSELLVDHCYVIPEEGGATMPAECRTPGSALVTDIFPGEDRSGENVNWSCTTDYFFVFQAPQMVVCVRRY